MHKLGAAHKEAGKAWGFVNITVPKARQPVNRDTFQFELLKDKLQDVEQRDGHYLLRGFAAGEQAAPLWERYVRLSEIEAAFQSFRHPINYEISAGHLAHSFDKWAGLGIAAKSNGCSALCSRILKPACVCPARLSDRWRNSMPARPLAAGGYHPRAHEGIGETLF